MRDPAVTSLKTILLRAALVLALYGLAWLLSGCRSEAAKTLRVGTPGDYAPYSLKTDDGSGDCTKTLPCYEGKDIERLFAFAKAHGYTPRLIDTTWPTLMADLTQGRFDMAIGGIAMTPARAQQALFTHPLDTDTKVPVARCSQLDRFDTPAELDRADVVILTNPGGTNEAYVRSHYRQATIKIIAKNQYLFEALKRGEGQVVVTDRTEAALQADSLSGLCLGPRGLPESAHQKAWLVAQTRPDLLKALNEWIDAHP
ncbi:MAG: transporter substrate-binding domain-containing protein [Cyanobacteria bacterium HKST-UBA06]|nr:transporter substrate-binding domain-containing protein [Cyanobacteria bacterium HKST-UBA06]